MGYYKDKIRAIQKIKAMCLIDKITVQDIKDYVRNVYGYGAKIVIETVEELERAGVIKVEYGKIIKIGATE